MKKCPLCGSKHTAQILYGEPVYDDDLKRKLANKELILGGCCISGMDPKYSCFDCDAPFGTPPVLPGKDGKEDYRDIAVSVLFSDGGYFGGHQFVRIEKKPEAIRMTVRFSGWYTEEDGDRGYQRLVTESEWKKLLKRLYCGLYIHEWQNYYDNPLVYDGEQWCLIIGLSDGSVREYGGSNAFPPYWKELKAVFRPFFKEVRFRL